MANLYGTSPNQVPFNSMLGNLAFQDKAYVSVDKIGIGTSFVDSGVANQPLQVNGSGYISATLGVGTSSPKVTVQVTGSTLSSASPTLGVASGNLYVTNSDSTYGLLVGNYTTGRSWLQVQRTDGTGTSYDLVLQPSGSNVGIGLTSPNTKLDVAGIGQFTSNGGTLNLVGADHTYIQFYPDGTGAGRKGYLGYPSAATDYIMLANEITGGVGHVILQPGGSASVGIGTTSPGALLEVYGTTRFGGTTSTGRRVDIATDGLMTIAYGNNTNSTVLNLDNVSDTGSTTDHGANILWRFGTNTTTTPINAGRISVLKSQQWTTTATTQDSYMVFELALDGVVSEKLRIYPSGAVAAGGNLTNGGFDFILGTTDQVNRGNSGTSRALVKDAGPVLVLNYSGDFTGGVRIDGPSVTIGGNLIVNGTTTTVNSTTLTIDDPIITLGGDTSVAEVTKDRGVEFKWNGTTLTITNYIGNGTTTVTGTVASTSGYAVGDIITISGATGTEQSKLNGTWTIASVPTGTTFTFVVSSTVTAGTYTTTLGTTVKSKNGFFGLDQSSGRFTFIPQSNNSSEVFSGTLGGIDCLDIQVNKGSLGTTSGNTLTISDFIHNNGNVSYLRIKATRTANGADWTTASTKLLCVTDVTEQGYVEFNPNGSNYGIAFGQGTTEFARFLTDGKFGIGITPTEKLHVSGNAIITGTVTISGGTITAGNVATGLLGGNTTTNITLGSGLTTGTLTLGSATGSGQIDIGNTGTAAAQNINIATATTGTITIGGTGATAVQLPTGKTKIGTSTLAQGGAFTYTLPSVAAGTIYVSGNTDVSLGDGGTNSSLTASAGSVVYSTASAMAFNTAGTSGQLLVSKGTAAPAFETFELSSHAPHSSYKSICRAATTADLAASTFASNVLTGYANTTTLACTATAGNPLITTTSTASIKVGASITINAIFTAAVTVTAINSATTFTVSSGTGVVAGTNVNTTFTNTIAGLVIDGITLAVNDRVLVKDQTTLGGLDVVDAPKYNGIYSVTATGSTTVAWSLTRTADADIATDLDGAIVNISEGTNNYGKSYKTRFKGTDTLNTTEMYWGGLIDRNSSTQIGTPTTKIAVDIATDTETIRLKSGAVTDLVTNFSAGIKTIQATAASTYTTASTVYIEGAPAAGTNATITTAYALQVAAGNTLLGGNLIVGNVDSSGTAALNIGTGANAKTITIGNGTGATSVVLNCGTGALNIGTNAFARTITIGNQTGASALTLDSGTGAINIGTAIAKTITIGNTTGATAIVLNVGTGLAKVGTDQIATLTATQTLTNKTVLGSTASINAAATLTAAQVQSGFILSTPTAAFNLQVPTGTTLDTITTTTDAQLDLVVFTTAAFAITLTVNTGVTILGSAATGATANSFARFKFRRTSTAATWVVYRVS